MLLTLGGRAAVVPWAFVFSYHLPRRKDLEPRLQETMIPEFINVGSKAVYDNLMSRIQRDLLLFPSTRCM